VPTATVGPRWTEEEVHFPFATAELFGILTLPTSPPPHPAIVLVTGAADTTTRVRAGASSQYHTETARRLVDAGYAVLRYDPPGVGRSSGEPGFETLDLRTAEALEALRYVQSRPDIHSDGVGLWGISQGAWVIAMAAAGFPDEVAFVVTVSGSGVSVAEQQVYGIEAQTRAGQNGEEAVAKAVLFGRLLIDWQLPEPIYREANEADAQTLGEGPWLAFLKLVYEPGAVSAAEGLQLGMDILRSVQDEPWARYIFLRELYIPTLESIPPDEVEAVKAYVGPNLLNDPAHYMTQVHCPVLAFFGEDDLLQPTAQSAALYEQYLTEAGNADFEIVVLPGVGHGIQIWTPGYWRVLEPWLLRLAQD
jgi:pimeloyl-ACP methyl ester carboxylesterase